MRFPWKDVRAALDKGNLPYSIHHYHKRGGQHVSNTIGAQAEKVASGTTSPPSRETCSFVYHIESGEGITTLECPNGTKTEIKWTARDTFAVPAWSQIQHTCTSTEDAYLFAVNDRPLLERLGSLQKA
jgi:gentisate 1,2-dioxygenase